MRPIKGTPESSTCIAIPVVTHVGIDFTGSHLPYYHHHKKKQLSPNTSGLPVIDGLQESARGLFGDK